MLIYTYYPDELYHFGVKGQKWGTRRYQNEDGSYKSGAEGRYNPDSSGGPRRSIKGVGHRALAKVYSINEKTYNKMGNKTLASMNKSAKEEHLKKAEAADKKKEEYRNSDEYKDKVARAKKIAKGAAIVAGTALVAYGAYKLGKAYGKSKLEYENAISSGRDAYDSFVKLQKSGQEKSHLASRALDAANKSKDTSKAASLLSTHMRYDTNANLDFKNSNINKDIADRYASKARNTAYYKIHSRLPGQKNRSISDVGARIANGKKAPKVSGLLQDMDMGPTRNADYYRRKLKARGKLR